MAQTKKQSTLSFTLGRFWGFIKRLLKNKKSAFGLIVIAFFIFLAFGSSLLTPYNALGEIPGKPFFPVGAPSMAPTWLRYLPTWLGGNPDVSQNTRVVQHSGLPSPQEVNFTWTGNGTIAENLDESVGFPGRATGAFEEQTQNGSLAIKYSRESGAAHNETTARVYAEFYWPYTGPPGRFMGSIKILVTGTIGRVRNVTIYNSTISDFQTVTYEYLDVPVRARVYMGEVGGKEWTLWPTASDYMAGVHMSVGIEPDYQHPIVVYVLSNTTGVKEKKVVGYYPGVIDRAMSGDPSDHGWIIDRDSSASPTGYIDSESNNVVNNYTDFGKNSFPARIVFRHPGTYVYGVELTFLDGGNSTKNVETTVHVDDFGLEIYGTSFGLLGTDHHGRDLFSQLIFGTRISLYLGLLVAGFSVVIGLLVGLAAGYLGKVVDEVLMRITDILLVLPGLPLLIVLVAILGTRLENLIILLGVLGWMGHARLVRSQVLSIKERPFVEAAKAIGASKFHIITNHVLPSVMSLVYITLATSVPGAVTAEAALSWLGFFDPERMSWGRMLNGVFEASAVTNWWWVIPPGLFISLLAASFILLGFALDEVLNPKLRLRR